VLTVNPLLTVAIVSDASDRQRVGAQKTAIYLGSRKVLTMLTVLTMLFISPM
jgi:hypothetical protein